MYTRLLAVFYTVLILVCSGSLLAEESSLACPGPFGPNYGYPEPGLFTTDLVDDDGAVIGAVDVWNTRDKINFVLWPNDDIKFADLQLWVGNSLGDIPEQKGKPKFSKFPFMEIDGFEIGKSHAIEIDMQDELDFNWQGRSHRWGFMLHGGYQQFAGGELVLEQDFIAQGPCLYSEDKEYPFSRILLYQPLTGHFVDSPVGGLSFKGPTQEGVTSLDNPDGMGGFLFFPGEKITFSIGSIPLGEAEAAKKVSPLDLFPGADIDDPRVYNIARTLQTLDEDSGVTAVPRDGRLVLLPHVVACFEAIAGGPVDWGNDALVTGLLEQAVVDCSTEGATLAVVDKEEAQANLESGLNASGIFRKNISKTEDFGETKQKLDVMPVYLPGLRSNGDPSLCVDADGDRIYDDGDELGVPYEEWRLNGDPYGEECDPRVDGETCVVTLIECREVAKPIVTLYRENIDIYDDQVKEDFWSGRFSTDIVAAISRDDGATWKRMNVSRMADLTSFELETGEPFPGTSGSPYLKVNDNLILAVWESKFCKSGRPRYAINLCDDPETEEIEADDPATEENECAVYCRGNADEGTEICEPDYPYDDPYFVTDIWGVRGQQRSVDYDLVDDVSELGIGEIPYSCLWAARGVLVTQKELTAGTFESMLPEDDPETEEDESDVLALGDIVWFKPERLTSGRRDAYIPAAASARGAGFAIAWQEDPSGLRPGKGKGPGEGWSGAISNNKTDIWYSFLTYDDFALVDGNFEPGGPGGGEDSEPDGDEGYLDKPGLGRPKALVPFSLPVRISDNDMVNVDTLKVEPSTDCLTLEDGADPVCFPTAEGDTFIPLDEEEIAVQFCGHPDADEATCCDPDNHEEDPNCEDLKGLYGNLNGTKRYAYLAKAIDDNGDNVSDYQYFVDNGGTLDLCDTSGANTSMTALPGTSTHERWYGFMNASGASKLVCVTSDGRLLDGDTSASRPNMQMQPYKKPDGTKSAWVLLGYEESKGMGHSLAASEHDNPVDEIIGDIDDDSGQDKPIKQDLGKNVLYHSFDFTQPDLVSPGHIVNLPALCGGLYPTYCDDPKTPLVIETIEDNPTCTCEPGQPVPLYFEYQDELGEWWPDDTLFMQYRTEIARRARFIVQSPSKAVKPSDGGTNTLGAIIYKQGQEGQGRPADVFIRRIVKSGTGNPYQFENFECTTYLDEYFTELPGCPNDGIQGYNCNVWGEAHGDRLCGGVIDGTTEDDVPFQRRDHINLTSADIDLAVDAGPDDDTPDDPTDDRYGTNKVILWSQHEYNLGNESYGYVNPDDGTPCDVLAGDICPAMYSNARSHRGFIRGDVLVTAFAYSPNWAAGRNGNDRYNFYIRKSFDGGQTWTTNPAGEGVYLCPEYRNDPTDVNIIDGSCGTYDLVVPDGELPPMPVGLAMTNYLDYLDSSTTTPDGVPAQFIGAGNFEPSRNMSEIKNNKETSSDPRVGATPPTYPIDGRVATHPILRFVEDEYVDEIFFVAWGTGDNAKKTGTNDTGGEATPLDLYYTRSEDFGDNFLKIPWYVNGAGSSFYGETVWRYERLAWGEEEQGECQLKATSDGSKAYAIFHQLTPHAEDPDAIPTRWYPWEVEESDDNDLWFRRLIFWPEEEVTP